ncbi:MAG: prepilin-type N-terminal cleavage/methylation domain-containing protein [Bacillota bacterium]|nr:prepilin-type N-terminal cleavage/methylation domain-containing protein [Bacillota bacterium]MDW7683214.1 prepilin-type N-terminal cleavage/methylation domain-containing protein [Bacillota bacterium]
MKFLRNQRGLSLAELVVVIALLGIVLAIGYTFYFFGVRAFNVGEDQSNVQRDIRIASSVITKEIRNATVVELVYTDAADGYHYIYFDSGNIKHRLDADVTTWTQGSIESLTFNIQQLPDGSNVVEFSIAGREDQQLYDITSKVNLNNLTGLPADSKPAIKYMKP